MMTIDELIEILTAAKNNKENILGGYAVVHLMSPNRPYIPIVRAELEYDDDGSVFLLYPEED